MDTLRALVLRKGGGRMFAAVNTACLLLFVALCLAPFLHIASVSLSSSQAILSGRVSLIPVDLNMEAYRKVFQDNAMLRSLVLSIVLTCAYTAFSMLMTVFAAYPLTKPIRGRKLLMVLIVVTMFFSGGVIPEYLLVKGLHLTNNLWSLILPVLINPFFLIILMSFFSSLPKGLTEAAEMDGSSHFRTLLTIVLPLSMPALATLSLFYAVGRWNGFMDSLLYITDPQLYPIQLKLYQIVSGGMLNDLSVQESDAFAAVLPESMKAASIMFATVPILIVYPWLQKYFISGVMVGAIKE
ncbi:carbohydrate ABC transporter permease [Paenibacillus macerans]|uniref:carbohydrate ABC transporter permease n=1 Tax=Paenibacillus macerans TaxID=44252 RepID=UPI003D31D3B0